MSKQDKSKSKQENPRANWRFHLEKGLVDILHEHNHTRFKGQNGWTAEGWRSIVKRFNEKYPSAEYTKSQIQDKEKELKGHYKAIRDGRKMSGAGWNESLCMINAEPEIWEKLIHDIPKLKKFQAKSFPLYYELEKLHEGSIATEDLNFTSTEPTSSELQPQPSSETTPIDIDAPDAHLNPFFANLDGQRASSEPIDLEEIETPASSCSEHKGNRAEKKRKLSIAGVLQGYVDTKAEKKRTLQIALDEKTKSMEKYSIKNCLDLLESIKELSDEKMAQATNVLKCEINREIFINFKNPRVRLLWIKGEIAPKD